MEIATVGTRICSNRDLFDLPVSTLLVGDNGEAYRIASVYGEKQVVVSIISE